MATRRRKLWWAAAAAYALLILYVSVIPIDVSPSVGRLDKVVHLCEYWLFAWLIARAIRSGGLKEPQHLLLVWLFATSYGLLIELIQGLLPWRAADWADALANATGAGVGSFLFLPRMQERFHFLRKFFEER